MLAWSIVQLALKDIANSGENHLFLHLGREPSSNYVYGRVICSIMLVDINDYVLVVVGLVVCPAALMQCCAFNHHGRAASWQCSYISRRATYDSPSGAPGGTTGDTSNAARCHGPTNSCFGFANNKPFEIPAIH